MELTQEFTLIKKVHTRDGMLKLTHPDGVEVLPKPGERSRLTNWRKLLVPERVVRIIKRDDAPILGFLKIAPEEAEWDSEPVGVGEWQVFWCIPE